VASCYFHPDRPGVGVCVRCRVVICAACRTRVDGVNHCHACLKVLGAGAAADARPLPRGGRPPGDLWPLAALGLFGLGWLLLFGLFWLVQARLSP
jgi:hypothetical protein